MRLLIPAGFSAPTWQIYLEGFFAVLELMERRNISGPAQIRVRLPGTLEAVHCKPIFIQNTSRSNFLFHAVLAANSKWYDPSYGTEYASLSFDETAFDNTPQQVSTAKWSSDPFNAATAYVCGH